MSYARDDLIALCEAGSRPQSVWHDRDSEVAQRQLGEAWALLRAGCDFSIEEGSDDETIWVRVVSKGFAYFEVGEMSEESFYIPTPKRLSRVGERDWY